MKNSKPAAPLPHPTCRLRSTGNPSPPTTRARARALAGAEGGGVVWCIGLARMSPTCCAAPASSRATLRHHRLVLQWTLILIPKRRQARFPPRRCYTARRCATPPPPLLLHFVGGLVWRCIGSPESFLQEREIAEECRLVVLCVCFLRENCAGCGFFGNFSRGRFLVRKVFSGWFCSGGAQEQEVEVEEDRAIGELLPWPILSAAVCVSSPGQWQLKEQVRWIFLASSLILLFFLFLFFIYFFYQPFLLFVACFYVFRW